MTFLLTAAMSGSQLVTSQSCVCANLLGPVMPNFSYTLRYGPEAPHAGRPYCCQIYELFSKIDAITKPYLVAVFLPTSGLFRDESAKCATSLAIQIYRECL